MVYVIDIQGKPMMPTERHGKVRHLLQESRAHVVRLIPFTIQLDYETTGYTQDVSLGGDSGSIHVGLSASTEKKELFSAECKLRDDIVDKISTRRELRRTRRSRKLRYRKARFDNRAKKKRLACAKPEIQDRQSYEDNPHGILHTAGDCRLFRGMSV